MMTTMTRKRNQRRKRNTKKESKVKVKVMSHIRRKRCVASAVILFTATVSERDGKAYKKKTF